MGILFVLGMALLAEVPSFALTNSVAAEDPAFDAVAEILVEARDEEGGSAPGYCNATFISDRELITAAHCLAHAWLLNSRNIEIKIGRYRYIKDKQGVDRRYYTVAIKVTDRDARFLLKPELEAKLRRSGFKTAIDPAEDNARIQLSRSIDLKGLALTPAKIASSAELNSMFNSQSQYPLTAVSVNGVAEISNNDTRRMAALNRVSWNSRGWIESKSTSQVEPMDSGSPVFTKWNGEWRLVAVTKGHAKSLFSEWDVFSILR